MSQQQKPIISLKDLTVTYMPGRSNEVKALQGISFDIFPGEYIIFFGPSGCGKSTLLYSIAGLERNIGGDIIVQERNLADMNQYQLEEYHQTVVGMIFQSFYLIGSLTVEQNVALPQVAILKKPAERLARARELLEKFGVGKQGKKLPTELSGGQQQRVAICRSIMNDPSIVIADEPVGNLDSKSSKDVMDLLRHLNEVEKKTVILVTHDPSHLNHANRIFFLRDGKVIDTKVNTPEERAQAVVSANMMQNAMKTLAGKHGAGPQQGNAKDEMAHRIFAEAVAGMGPEEMEELEKRIQNLTQRKRANKRSISGFLAKPVAKGGIGMRKGKAEHVADEITGLIRESRKTTHVAEKKMLGKHTAEDDNLPLTMLEARILRRHLLDKLDIRLASEAAVPAVEEMIQKHLERSADRTEMLKRFCQPVKAKGAGMSGKEARLLARHIELIVLDPTANAPAPEAVAAPVAAANPSPGATAPIIPPADDEG